MKTLSEYNNSWYMTTKKGHIYRKLCGQITTANDILRDFKITGRSLVKYVPSIDKTKSTGSESTRYWSLDTIFKDFDFNQSGGFIDIGCGNIVVRNKADVKAGEEVELLVPQAELYYFDAEQKRTDTAQTGEVVSVFHVDE